PRPDLPLPTASSPGTGNITIYGWSTRCSSCLHREPIRHGRKLPWGSTGVPGLILRRQGRTGVMVMVMVIPSEATDCPAGRGEGRLAPSVAVPSPVEDPSLAVLLPRPGLLGGTRRPTVTRPVDEVTVGVQPRGLPGIVLTE